MISFLPVILIGVLFGLAMDYEVFLVSRMREEYVHGAEPRARGRHRRPARGPGGHRRGADHDLGVRRLRGHRRRRWSRRSRFGLAVGILVDAFVVRMTLVPAVLALLGRSAWWLPRWLDRILPDVDVEGARLGDTRPPPRTGSRSGPRADRRQRLAGPSPPASAGAAALVLSAYIASSASRTTRS